MSSVDVAAANEPDKSAPAPVGMVTHLKHLIESLPVCVMRADLEGCLLAANDSALHLLGVTEHANVLGKSLSERISAEHAEDWRGFLRRTWTEGASSVECEFVDFTGARRIIFIKSVAQPMHADGIQSLILTAQDLASRRRLERALNEHQGCATTIDALQSQLRQSEAERQRLVTLLETVQTESTSTPAKHESADATLAQQVEELRGVLEAKDQEWQKRCDELTVQLSEQHALVVHAEQRAAEQQRLLDASAESDAQHQSKDETLRERIAELEHSAATNDQEWQKRCDDLTAQLENAAAERQKQSKLAEERDDEPQRLSLLLEQRDAEHQQLSRLLEQRVADHQAAGVALQQRIDELERTRKASQETWQKRCDELSAELADVTAERQRVSNALAQRESDHQTTGDTLQQRIEELERVLKSSEAEWQRQRAELTAKLAGHAAEHERLSVLLKQRDAEHQQLSEAVRERDAEYKRVSELLQHHEGEQQRLSDLVKQRDGEHQAAVESLHQQVAECERALTANDEAWKQRCNELATQLTAQDEERKERWEQVTAQLVEHASERQRLSDLLEHRQTEQRRLIDEHAQEKMRIEQTVRGECERAHAGIDEARRREIDALQQKMQQLAGDLQRTAGELARRTAEYERLTADVHDRDTHEPVDPAEVQRLMKSVAAYRIELVQVTENTIRTLEPMATAGRVAIASSRELQAAVEAVDARSKQLLAQCALDDANRPEIECLRRDSIGAASLVRQLLQVFGESARSTASGRPDAGRVSSPSGKTPAASADGSGHAVHLG